MVRPAILAQATAGWLNLRTMSCVSYATLASAAHKAEKACADFGRYRAQLPECLALLPDDTVQHAMCVKMAEDLVVESGRIAAYELADRLSSDGIQLLARQTEAAKLADMSPEVRRLHECAARRA